jgi:hypothetical protein
VCCTHKQAKGSKSFSNIFSRVILETLKTASCGVLAVVLPCIQEPVKYVSNIIVYLYLSLLCEGKSLLEYCLDIAERSFSPRPCPPRAGSKVGLAAVVIFPIGK